MKKLKFLWCYYFGGWIEEEDTIYGFYGVIPTRIRHFINRIKQLIK